MRQSNIHRSGNNCPICFTRWLTTHIRRVWTFCTANNRNGETNWHATKSKQNEENIWTAIDAVRLRFIRCFVAMCVSLSPFSLKTVAAFCEKCCKWQTDWIKYLFCGISGHYCDSFNCFALISFLFPASIRLWKAAAFVVIQFSNDHMSNEHLMDFFPSTLKLFSNNNQPLAIPTIQTHTQPSKMEINNKCWPDANLYRWNSLYVCVCLLCKKMI